MDLRNVFHHFVRKLILVKLRSTAHNVTQCLENEVDLEAHLKSIQMNDSQHQQSRRSKRKLNSNEDIPAKRAKTDVLGFASESCQKSFTRKANLTQHIRKFHMNKYDIS